MIWLSYKINPYHILYIYIIYIKTINIVNHWGIENPSFHSAKRGASLLGPEVPTGYPPWQEQGNSDHAGVLNGSKRLVCVQGVYESRLLLDTISTHQSTSGPPNWQCCNINHNVIYCTVVPFACAAHFNLSASSWLQRIKPTGTRQVATRALRVCLVVDGFVLRLIEAFLLLHSSNALVSWILNWQVNDVQQDIQQKQDIAKVETKTQVERLWWRSNLKQWGQYLAEGMLKEGCDKKN